MAEIYFYRGYINTVIDKGNHSMLSIWHFIWSVREHKVRLSLGILCMSS